MLEKKKLVGDQSLLPLLDQLFLQIQASLIVDQTEMPNVEPLER